MERSPGLQLPAISPQLLAPGGCQPVLMRREVRAGEATLVRFCFLLRPGDSEFDAAGGSDNLSQKEDIIHLVKDQMDLTIGG